MTVTLLALVEQDTRVTKNDPDAGTYGGEYKFPCPKCGGEDRFCVWPNHPASETGRFWCRGCNIEGDAIAYLKQVRGLGYRVALRELGLPDPQGDAPILTAKQARVTFSGFKQTYIGSGQAPARQEEVVVMTAWILPEVAWVCLDKTLHDPDPIPWPVILYDKEGIKEIEFHSAGELLAAVDWDAWGIPPTEKQAAWLKSIGRVYSESTNSAE